MPRKFASVPKLFKLFFNDYLINKGDAKFLSRHLLVYFIIGIFLLGLTVVATAATATTASATVATVSASTLATVSA